MLAESSSRLVASSKTPRLAWLDALRGAAMAWMAAYHFAFDLNHFGLLAPRQDFNADPLWTLQRSAIVSLFVFCAGFALAAALRAGQTWPCFWRRWAQVAACALLVSAGSAWMFPRSWIWFGVLHAMAAMLVLARLAAPLGPRVLWPLAAAAIALPWLATLEAPALMVLGLHPRKPVTEDWVPLLPWFGVLLCGLAAGQGHLARPRAGVRLPAALAPLVALGRWPLSFYMLHQPLLIGAITAATTIAR